MAHVPAFSVTPALLAEVDRLAPPRERIQGAVDAGVVEKVGGNETGRYVLKNA